MSILSTVKDAFVYHYYTWIGAVFSVVVGLLATMDRTSDFTMSLVGIHNKVTCPQGYQGPPTIDPCLLYTAGLKDLLTVLVLHLPICVILTFIWDFMSKYPSGAARTQFCFYFTSGLMLASCLMYDFVEVIKEGYLTSPSFWWNGLPNGYMTYSVKLYFLVQSALLCYFLETLIYTRQSVPEMLDSWIDGLLNLGFSGICYMINSLPLMMMVFLPRLCLQAGMSFVQVMSLLELSGPRREYTRVFLRCLRWLTGGEMICYLGLMLATCVFSVHPMMTKAFIVVPLVAMLAVSGRRILNSRKFDLDLLRAGDGNQAAGAAAMAPPAAAPTKKKARK